MDNRHLMTAAMVEAQAVEIDVPVGALIVDEAGRIVARSRNQKEVSGDPTAHAEILAMRKASEVTGNWRLEGFKLVVTLEPCVMCAGAIVASRLEEVVFGAFDNKLGAGGSIYDVLRDPRLGNPLRVTGGVMEPECSELLRAFFRARRD